MIKEESIFKNNIKNINENEMKILDLQRKYKSGKIKKEEMSEIEYKKLIELYKMQNKRLEEEIEIKRRDIKKKLEDLKS